MERLSTVQPFITDDKGNALFVNSQAYFDYVWHVEGQHPYDEERLLEFLKDVQEDEFVLDVAAGWHGFAEYAVRHDFPGMYCAIDFSSVARERTYKTLGNKAYKLLYDVGDAINLPYMNNAYDRVGCGEFIEHLEEPALLIAELHRVCRSGGRVIISTVNAYCPHVVQRGGYRDHVWGWRTADEVAQHYFSPEDFVSVRAWECGIWFFVEGIKR